VDAPYHFFENGISIDRVDLTRLCGKTVLLDLSRLAGPGCGFSTEDLRQAAASAGAGHLRGWRVVIKTGWEKNYGGPGYYKNNPHLTGESAAWLVQEGVTLVGLDFPPDGIGDKMTVPAPAPVHQSLLGAGICLLENLAGLDKLPTAVFSLLCLPLRLEGEGGGPARVIAYGGLEK
jgi:kynurenine formamidase